MKVKVELVGGVLDVDELVDLLLGHPDGLLIRGFGLDATWGGAVEELQDVVGVGSAFGEEVLFGDEGVDLLVVGEEVFGDLLRQVVDVHEGIVDRVLVIKTKI